MSNDHYFVMVASIPDGPKGLGIAGPCPEEQARQFVANNFCEKHQLPPDTEVQVMKLDSFKTRAKADNYMDSVVRTLQTLKSQTQPQET